MPTRITNIVQNLHIIDVEENLNSEDKERVKLLNIVAKKGLGELSIEQLKRLQILVEKKDYSHSRKANKSKIKLLAKINVAIYETEEGRQGI